MRNLRDPVKLFLSNGKSTSDFHVRKLLPVFPSPWPSPLPSTAHFSAALLQLANA